MKKLIDGIVDFRRNVRPQYQSLFGHLAAGQAPDSLMVACSDSRVAPNVFASTNPGDMFVVRNVGNLVPVREEDIAFSAERAALEFSLKVLPVKDIIICGHSSCGAVLASMNQEQLKKFNHLGGWLNHIPRSMADLGMEFSVDKKLSEVDKLSQISVLKQIKNLVTYKTLNERIKDGSLKLHAWWFDLESADVLYFNETERRFIVIDEASAPEALTSTSTAEMFMGG